MIWFLKFFIQNMYKFILLLTFILIYLNVFFSVPRIFWNYIHIWTGVWPYYPYKGLKKRKMSVLGRFGWVCQRPVGNQQDK